MTKAKLIKMLAAREGKKSQVKIGDIREIVSLLERMLAESAFVCGDDSISDFHRVLVFGCLSPGAYKKLEIMNKKKPKQKTKKKK